MNWSGVPLKGQSTPPPKQVCKRLSKQKKPMNTIRWKINWLDICQLQFYLMISNTPSCYFANKFGNRRWECVHVAKNGDYLDAMKKNCFSFGEYIDTAPPNPDQVEVDTDKVLINQMVKRNANQNNYFTSLVDTYFSTATQHSQHEETKKELKSLWHQMKENCIQIGTLRRDKRGSIRIVIH